MVKTRQLGLLNITVNEDPGSGSIHMYLVLTKTYQQSVCPCLCLYYYYFFKLYIFSQSLLFLLLLLLIYLFIFLLFNCLDSLHFHCKEDIILFRNKVSSLCKEVYFLLMTIDVMLTEKLKT